MDSQNYVMVDLRRMFALFKAVGGKAVSLKIIALLIRDCDPFTREYFGSVRQISEMVNCPKSTTARVLKALEENGFIAKVRPAVWILQTEELSSFIGGNLWSQPKVE